MAAGQFLQPPRTYFLARLPSSLREADVVSDLLDHFERKHIGNPRDSRASRRRKEVREIEAPYVDMEVGVLLYEEGRIPSWTTDRSLENTEHHLLLIARYQQLVAVHASDDSIRRKLIQDAKTRGVTVGFKALERLSPGAMNAAFTDGTPKTAWLGGAHPRTSLKADAKALSSQDLRDTLDPIGDQSYTSGASRWHARVGRLGELSVTLTPRDSRIYCGRSRDWDDWSRVTREVLRAAASVSEELVESLPVVAAAAQDATGVRKAIEIGLYPPELSREEPCFHPDLEAEKEAVARSLSFEDIEPEADGPELRACMYWIDSVDGTRELIGIVEIRPDLRDPQRVKMDINYDLDGHGYPNGAVKRYFNDTGSLTILYDSGHTIVNNKLVIRRYRDFPFNDFKWVNFKSANLLKEKPKTLSLDTLGCSDSLFCWVTREWPNLGDGDDHPGGWLACDDGQGEIADFVHLDDESHPPMLSFIHVKAAASDSVQREISVTAFEIVVSQAVKSIRRLDDDRLRGWLRGGGRASNASLVWHDREPAVRDEMLHAFERVRSGLQRQLVIIQPHMSKGAHDSARLVSSDHGNGLRIKQIDTLLYSAAMNSQGMGARLIVLADSAH